MVQHPKNPDWANEIEYMLRDISKVLRRRGRESLGQFGITPPQFDALLFINDNGEMTIGDLSTKMYLAYSTTTDLVDRMERNQLVERVRDKQDRRVVRLRLLTRGQEIIEKVVQSRQTYLTQVLDGVDETMVEEWKRMLKTLHDRIAR